MNSRTVLIVEDEPRIAHWLTVHFERAGFGTAVAGDGRTGLAVARSRRPHLVVLDLMLPRLDGMQVRRILTTTALGGVLVAAVALAVAAWLSRRITAPVTRLTEAAGRIAQRRDSALVPVTSDDELER